MRLRDYQEQAVDSIYERWQESDSTLAVLATGLGKTVIAAHVIERLPQGRALFVAHREELIWQAASKIKSVTGSAPGVEMADYKADTHIFGKERVVVSSVQTQNAGRSGAGRMTRFSPDEFSLLIIDEAHHSPAASYRRMIQYYRQNPNLKVLGITATPDRTDEAAMGQVFESVAFDYGILEGIQNGWLVPVEQRCVKVNGLDLSAVRTVGGDLSGVDLAEVMEEESNLHEIASPTMEIVGKRKSLVFAASVKHAERLCEIFNRHRTDCARWACGETPKDQRRQMFADYAAGRFQILVNVGIAAEGFDEPGIEVVVMARPTKSRCLYTQIIGRGTRPLGGIVDGYELAEDRRMVIAESAKPCVEVIDFVGNSGKHKLVTTADILGGKYSDEVIDRARRKAADSGKSIDMLEALRASMAELHAEKERQKAIEAAHRQRLRVRAEYSSHNVDPFDVLQIEPHREMGWDAGKHPTERMVALLEKQGIEGATEMTYGQASQLIAAIKGRWDNNMASFKQAKLLQKYGLPGDVSRDQAKEWLDKISGNKWRLPAELKVEAERGIEVF